MNYSGFALTEQMKKHFAVGYKPAGSDGTYERSSYPTVELATGMLYSNVDDLANFLSLFFREGPRGGKQVLGSSSLLEMLLPVAVGTDLSRDERGRPIHLWREGSTIGFSAGPFPLESSFITRTAASLASHPLYISITRASWGWPS
jgi:hypothetical protein